MNRRPCNDVMVEIGVPEETGAFKEWVMNDLEAAASQDTEVDVSHLQSGTVSGVLKEPQHQSDTVTELKCVGEGKELDLAAEYKDSINSTLSHLSDTERQLNNVVRCCFVVFVCLTVKLLR